MWPTLEIYFIWGSFLQFCGRNFSDSKGTASWMRPNFMQTEFHAGVKDLQFFNPGFLVHESCKGKKAHTHMQTRARTQVCTERAAPSRQFSGNEALCCGQSVQMHIWPASWYNLFYVLAFMNSTSICQPQVFDFTLKISGCVQLTKTGSHLGWRDAVRLRGAPARADSDLLVWTCSSTQTRIAFDKKKKKKTAAAAKVELLMRIMYR